MKTLPVLKLWWVKGASLAEIRGRLKERTDEECSLAVAELLATRQITRRQLGNLAKVAVVNRNTREILAALEVQFAKQAAAEGREVEPALVELAALMIDFQVRMANRLFPQ